MRPLAHLCLLLLLAACSASGTPGTRWQSYEREAVADGFLRTERDPYGVVVSPSQTLRNFREIFFYSEYGVEDGRYVVRRDPIPLEKRSGETTWLLIGAGVTKTDRRHVGHVAALIEASTGLAIREVDSGADILIAIVDVEEREDMADWMQEKFGDNALSDDLRNDLGEDLCIAVPFTQEDESKDAGYLIIIPNETSGVLRRSCIEEEFAHAFGPSADFEDARPSIFNDDQEFALLTVHDQMLLRILYDPRLRAGMSEQEALPILRRIVAEIVPKVPAKAGDRRGTPGETKSSGT